MIKRTILATLTGTALLASGASFADNRHGDNRHGGNQQWGHNSRHVVQHYQPQRYQPYYQHYQYRPAPRYVVVNRPGPAYYPGPVYYNNNGLAVLAGAVIGSAIGYHISNGH